MNSTNHTGAAGEMLVCAFFLSHSLEVFRNVASSGPIDLVVINMQTNKSALVDVKSVRSPYTRADGSICLPKKSELRSDGVWQIAYVHGETAPRLPEGFWEALGMETAE
jgi:Holliday junction resolvase-like predicted endonuclease